ncbi:phospholipase D-like domain-containing protein [Kineosporia mesophila]|uniref:Phospholipase D-like domain-containing protein n=1 Tax=Kineosporia mesophila TaxID=566012 RepID=A0ABP6Z3Z1_9ACTN|nr:phospholipase D-like domain-containing protein [Kineosporia mesophila]MCD5351130.1 phospholipase D-like domain-containing protein [Kineosporia mesophila]
MSWDQALTWSYVVGEYIIKIFAVGTVPENRRPASSSAWLLLILFLPVVGLPLFWLIGSPYVQGRRYRIQAQANHILAERSAHLPLVPEGVNPSQALTGLLRQNRQLTGMPCVDGRVRAVHDDAVSTYLAMAAAVDAATQYVSVEFYIMSWDDTTDPFFTALKNAVGRGVRVRLLMDHLGSRKYPHWNIFQKRLTLAGIEWHLMMPIKPLQGRWRRPDLRNHRKLLVVDGDVAFIGSHNLIDPHYGSETNARVGRAWHDLSLEVTGEVVASVEAVFATDWFIETGELVQARRPVQDPVDHGENALQIVPSGPGFPTEPNLRLFVSLIHMATRRVAITSPYFVPDESLLAAITTAVYRGVTVELFVGEQADQFLVGHAQRSYYRALLEAGVHIHLYPAPAVLHAKYLTVDDEVGVIGSSNMDFRSFALTYEVMLLGFGGDLVKRLQANDDLYRSVSRELTLEEWLQEPWRRRYVDNVCRLTAALM